MNKTIHFISGLPRSGSTLLCNILAQNPRFHVTATSGILDVMFAVRNQWDTLVEFKAHPDEPAKLRVLKGILESYFADIDTPVIFDKSRGWLAYLEMAEMILDRKAKVLVPVRDTRDILASFEKIWRKSSSSFQLSQEKENYILWQTIGGRCKVWSADNQPLGIAYNRVKDAIQRGYLDRMLFVDYDDLTAHSGITMARIYEFLEEEIYPHQFNNVEQITYEDDTAHGFPPGTLHTIRAKVEPQEPQWPSVLGDVADAYKDANFWKP